MGKLSREGVAGADGIDKVYRRKVKEVGLGQGVFTWYCPLPGNNEDAEVDLAWMVWHLLFFSTINTCSIWIIFSFKSARVHLKESRNIIFFAPD